MTDADMASRRAVRAAAWAAYDAGLCVIPPAEDGSKRPLGAWERWQEERPSRAQMESWYGHRRGLGVVTGGVSRQLECFEFDDPDAYGAFLERAEAVGLGDLVRRIREGYCERTPKGVHWFYFCDEIAGNTKLARRPKRPEEMADPNDKYQVMIETRGEGGFIIVAPSFGPIHPSGKPYVAERGTLADIATITPAERAELHRVARSLDAIPPKQAAKPLDSERDGRPGDDFNRRASWADILEPAGWRLVYTHGDEGAWRRPGKRDGISATTNYAGSGLLKVFTSSSEFEQEATYSKFGAYAVLYHNGDHAAAAAELARQGYGDPEAGRAGAGRPAAATQLVQAAEKAGIAAFLSADDTAYLRVPVNGHTNYYRLNDRAAKEALIDCRIRTGGEGARAPSASAIADALAALSAQARFSGERREVYVRVAPLPSGEGVAIDLGRGDGATVLISAEGREVTIDSPVAFRRPTGMLPLPLPERSSSSLCDLLRPFINTESDSDLALLATLMVDGLCPVGPYALTVLTGPQGSAKSTTSRVIKAILDPHTADLRAAPRDDRAVAIAASNSWLLAFDNQSGVRPWFSDILCGIVTGTAIPQRSLYTNDEETYFRVQRPVVLNSIEELGERPDLLSRSVIVALPRIPDARRRTEKEFWAAFQAALPRILGALYDAMAHMFRVLPATQLEGMPRMADFALRGYAVAPALGWTGGEFLAAYDRKQAAADDLAIDASPIASIVRALLPDLDGVPVTAEQLLGMLNGRAPDALRKSKGWPDSAQKLSNALRRVEPSLRAQGVEVEFFRRGGGARQRLIRLTAADTQSGATAGRESGSI
jgi:hypothetical protein